MDKHVIQGDLTMGENLGLFHKNILNLGLFHSGGGEGGRGQKGSSIMLLQELRW